LRRMTEFVEANRLPAICNFTEFPKLGGLMGYAPSLPDEFRHAAGHIDKILKGAKPADLPVEQPTRFQLVINLKTAQAGAEGFHSLEGNMCGTAMRGADALPGSKATSRAKGSYRKLGGVVSGHRRRVRCECGGPHREGEEP